MKENNIQILKEDDETELVTEGNSILYVAQDQKIIALIGVKDLIKEGIVCYIDDNGITTIDNREINYEYL